MVKMQSEKVRGVDAEEDEDLILKLKMVFVVAVVVSETGTRLPPSWLWPDERVTDANWT